MIPQSVLDQIQDRSDIVEVIQQVVPLRKMVQRFVRVDAGKMVNNNGNR